MRQNVFWEGGDKKKKRKLGLEDQLSACLWSVFLTDFHTSPDNFRTTKSAKEKAFTSASWANFMSQIHEICDHLKQTGWKCFYFLLTTWWGFFRSVCRLDLHFKALLFRFLQLFTWIDASKNVLGSLRSPFWNRLLRACSWTCSTHSSILAF